MQKQLCRQCGALIGAILLIYSLSGASEIDLQLQKAKEASYNQRYEDAISLYDAVLQEAPGNREAMIGKARVLSWSKRYEDARALYQQVLSAYPGDFDALAGTADTYAWQRDYRAALAVLDRMLPAYRENREVLLRRSRFHLWAGDKDKALFYSNRILDENPDDEEAMAVRQQAKSLYTAEYFVGYRYLRINDNADGRNAYAGVRYEPGKQWSAYGQIDYLDRFNEIDTRFLAGGSLKLTQQVVVSSELSLAPDAEIYPRVSGWIEMGYPAMPALTLYINGRASEYREVKLYSASAAGEYYVMPDVSLLVRYTLSRSRFDSGGHSTDDAVYAKLTRYLNDTDSLYAYYSHGNESYKSETLDNIGGIDADVFGIGAKYFLTPVFGIAPSLEFQDREGGTEYLEAGLEIMYRM